MLGSLVDVHAEVKIYLEVEIEVDNVIQEEALSQQLKQELITVEEVHGKNK